MNFKTLSLLLFVGVLLVSCSQSDQQREDPETPQSGNGMDAVETSNPQDLNPPITMESATGHLPGREGLEEWKKEYEVEDVVVSSVCADPAIDSIRFVTTAEFDFLLERYGLGVENPQVYDFGMEDFNPYNLDVRVEWIGADSDPEKNDAVIWYSTSDGTSGRSEGYEMDHDFLMVLDVAEMMDYANIHYADHYLTYSAEGDADYDDPEFHAKMDENTLFESCDWTFECKLEGSDIILKKVEAQSENMDDCSPPNYKDGRYAFNEEAFLYLWMGE